METPFVDSLYCERCGMTLEGDASFCTRCGSNQTTHASNPMPKKQCSKCGRRARAQVDSHYCPDCGQKLFSPVLTPQSESIRSQNRFNLPLGIALGFFFILLPVIIISAAGRLRNQSQQNFMQQHRQMIDQDRQKDMQDAIKRSTGMLDKPVIGSRSPTPSPEQPKRNPVPPQPLPVER